MSDIFPLYPSPTYGFIIWLTLVLGIGLIIAAFWFGRRLKKMPLVAKPLSSPVQSSTKPAPKNHKVFTQTAALAAIKKLEDNLDSQPKADIGTTYVSLSYIVRRYVDDNKGTDTLSMSDEELQKSDLGALLKQIIHECYQLEFSGRAGSIAQCQQLLRKSQELIRA